MDIYTFRKIIVGFIVERGSKKQYLDETGISEGKLSTILKCAYNYGLSEEEIKRFYIENELGISLQNLNFYQGLGGVPCTPTILTKLDQAEIRFKEMMHQASANKNVDYHKAQMKVLANEYSIDRTKSALSRVLSHDGYTNFYITDIDACHFTVSNATGKMIVYIPNGISLEQVLNEITPTEEYLIILEQEKDFNSVSKALATNGYSKTTVWLVDSLATMNKVKEY